MPQRETMIQAALAAMTHVLDLGREDQVLVLTDQTTLDCGRAFAAAAERHGCRVDTFVLPAKGRPLQETPAGLLPLLEDRTVVVNAIVGDAREIPFRLQWIQAIEDTGRIRLGHSPGITAEMMTAGPLNVDYALMTAGARRLAGLLDGAESLHLTSALGTDLELDVRGRRFVDDLKATVQDGANLPCGEIYCCPVETGADGMLVIDGCYGSAGTVPAPVTIEVRGGRAIAVTGPDPAVVRDIEQLMATDRGSSVIAELGIGLNPGARLTDNMLEAEKAHGTAHIAFGSNQGMPGGRNDAATHIDYLFTRPDITARLAGGGRRVVLKDGRVPPRG